MRTRRLRTGTPLTEIGFGGAQIGNLYRETPDDVASCALQRAWNEGIRYFDTAPHYGLGLSERRLGGFLAAHPRDEYVVSTKVGRLLEASPSTAHESDPDLFAVPAAHRRVWDFSRDGIRRSIEASLERLRIDRIDIAYLHDPDEHGPQAMTEGAAALVELRDEGVIGAWGVGMNQWQMPLEFVRRTDIDVVMIAGRYTLLDRSAEPLLDAAADRGVGIVAAGVYSTGILGSDRVDRDATFNYAPADDALRERVRVLAEQLGATGVTVPAVAVQFALRHPAVVSVVVGVRSDDHVEAAIRRYEEPIPAEAWRVVDSMELDR